MSRRRLPPPRSPVLIAGLSCLGALGGCEDGSGNAAEPPATWLADEVVEFVRSGSEHSCAVLADGTVACWGGNACGILGDGTSEVRDEPVRVLGLSNVVDLSAGALHSCAVVADGGVECWGLATLGRLGSAQLADACPSPTGTVFRGVFAPSPVENLPAASSVAAGWFHSCAVVEGGESYCWGRGDSGQLGDGRTEHSNCEGVDCATEPVRVVGLDGAVELALGLRHTCALVSDGTVSCWGAGDAVTSPDPADPRCPEQHTTCATTPVPVPGVEDAVSITAGQNHTCALTATGAVLCWGDDDDGRLGGESADGGQTPVRASAGSDVVQIDAGSFHTCVVARSGQVRCWGDNRTGQLGDGTTAPATEAVEVSGLEPVLQVSAGHLHSCGLQEDGSVHCWGAADDNRLGAPASAPCADDAASQTCALTPVIVP